MSTYEPMSPKPDSLKKYDETISKLDPADIAIINEFETIITSKEKNDKEHLFITKLNEETWVTQPFNMQNLSRENLIAYMNLYRKTFPDQVTINSRWDEMIEDQVTKAEMTPFVERIHAAILSGYAKNAAAIPSDITNPSASTTISTGPGKPPIHPPSNMDTKHSKEPQGVTVSPSTSSTSGTIAKPDTRTPTSTSGTSTVKKSSTDAAAKSTDVKSKAADVTAAYGAGANNGTNAPSPATSTTAATSTAASAAQQTTPGTPPAGQSPQQSSLQFESSQPAKPTPPLQHHYATLRDLASAKRLVDISANNPIVAEGDPGPRTEQQLKEANAKFTKAITDKYGSLNVHATYNNNDGSVKVTIPNKRNPENPQQHDELERRLENGKPKVKLTNPPDDVSINILLEQNADILPLKMSQLCTNNLDTASRNTNLDTILRLMEASTISGREIHFNPADMAALTALENSNNPTERALLDRFDYLDALRQEQGPQLEAFKQHVKAEENAGRRWEYGQSTITKELLAQKPELPKPEAESPSPGPN